MIRVRERFRGRESARARLRRSALFILREILKNGLLESERERERERFGELACTRTPCIHDTIYTHL